MSSYEYDWYYKILPTLKKWNLDSERIKGAKKLEECFIYSSDSNRERITFEQFQDFMGSDENYELQELNI